MTDKQDGHASQAAQEADAVDDRGLAFIYQEQTPDGQTSRFNKLVSRDAS